MNKQIVRLAVPSILANITIPLVGLVDTAIVGHVGNAVSIGGIAIGTMLFDLLYWNFGFLRVGTSGMTAQAYGRESKVESKELKVESKESKVESAPSTLHTPHSTEPQASLHRTHSTLHITPSTKRSVICGRETGRLLKQSLGIAAIAAVFIWAIQWLFVTAVLAVVPCSPAVAEVARDYFFVRIWAAPATLSLMAFKGWFIGMQDTRSPMAVDIVVNVVNMVASYALAVYTPLGIIGVAWGTLIAQYTGLLLAVVLLLARYSVQWREDEPIWSGMKRFMQLNGNIFVRSLCFMVVYVGFTSIAGSYGDIELAVSSILMKLFMFFSYFIDGFAYAGEALVGKNWGIHSTLHLPPSTEPQASLHHTPYTVHHTPSTEPQASLHHTPSTVHHTPSTVHHTPYTVHHTPSTNALVRYLLLWTIAMGMVFTLVYAIWGDDIIRLMTDDRDVLAASKQYLIWLISMPLVSSLAFIWDGIYVGATAGKEIRNAMIYAALAFALVYASLYHLWGIQALYLAYLVHLIVRAMYLRLKWKKVYVQEVRK